VVRAGWGAGPVVLRHVGILLSGSLGAVAIGLAVVVAAAVVWSGTVNQMSVDTSGLVRAVAAVAAVGLLVGVVGRALRWWATWGVVAHLYLSDPVHRAADTAACGRMRGGEDRWITSSPATRWGDP
jgi:hypothetical protein